MSSRRLGVGVAVLGGFLYAVGGSDGSSPLSTGRSHANYCMEIVTIITISRVK